MLPSVFNSPLDRLTRDLDRLFGVVAPLPVSGVGVGWAGMNVWREGESFMAEMELPGVRREDLEVLVSGDALTIRGRREADAPAGARSIHVERATGSFERSVRLPAPVESEEVRASLEHGVLRIVLPVSRASLPRRVEVGGGPLVSSEVVAS